MAGHIVHIEIPTDDIAAGTEFWGSLFGWQFQAYPADGPGEYHMTRTGEDQGVAVTSMQPAGRGPRAYFDVDDISDGVARVRELAGEADEPMPVPGMGWFATCTDPHGNEFGLWQNDPSAPGPTG